MNLQDQVCSLELSKKLKELGVKQESLFWWYSFNELPFRITYENETPCTNKSRVYSAFTVAELGEMLPIGFVFSRITDEWFYCGKGYEKEVDARSNMLIYLIENGLIENEI